ncbi:MAG TPA: hypothetical protein VGF07_11865 [Stellaceae bacterium]|jgi:hypothetical protein
MPAETTGRDKDGFAFTDEDFTRRYTTGDGGRRVVPDLPHAPPVPAKPAAHPTHGGGNSYMRARRRRMAARGL